MDKEYVLFHYSGTNCFDKNIFGEDYNRFGVFTDDRRHRHLSGASGINGYPEAYSAL